MILTTARLSKCRFEICTNSVKIQYNKLTVSGILVL